MDESVGELFGGWANQAVGGTANRGVASLSGRKKARRRSAILDAARHPFRGDPASVPMERVAERVEISVINLRESLGDQPVDGRGSVRAPYGGEVTSEMQENRLNASDSPFSDHVAMYAAWRESLRRNREGTIREIDDAIRAARRAGLEHADHQPRTWRSRQGR